MIILSAPVVLFLSFLGAFSLWAVAAVLMLLYLARWRGRRRMWLWPALSGVLLLAGVACLWAGLARKPASAPVVAETTQIDASSREVFSIIAARCQACHSAHATMMPMAAWGLSLDSMEDVRRNAVPIHRQVVELEAMPIGNATHMTREERAVIARWYAEQAR